MIHSKCNKWNSCFSEIKRMSPLHLTLERISMIIYELHVYLANECTMNRPAVVPINRSENQCNSLDPKGTYPIDPGVFTSAALNLCIIIMIHTSYTCIFIIGSFENHFVMLSMLNFGPHDPQKLGQ